MAITYRAYTFIRKEDPIWVALGILVKDSDPSKPLKFDYNLPLDSSKPQIEAELGAMYEFAATARLSVSQSTDTHIVWKVISQETIDYLENDALDVNERLDLASTTHSVEIMEPMFLAAALKELGYEPETNI